MNEVFSASRFRRLFHRMTNCWSVQAPPLRRLAGPLLALCGAGCDFGDRDSVRMELQERRLGGDPRRIGIRAEVTGTLPGLRYKWFAVVGECEPQESELPETVLKFAEGSKRDRIVAEAWRQELRVGQSQIGVTLDEERLRLATEKFPKVQIEITDLPPYEPDGGPHTRGEIAGKVSGEISPEHKVDIYARADAWYMKTVAYASHA